MDIWIGTSRERPRGGFIAVFNTNSPLKLVVKKKKRTVPTVFKCLFCNHADAVTVLMDSKTNIGDLKCEMCGANFQCVIHALSDPIDVYSEWFDETEAKQKETLGGQA